MESYWRRRYEVGEQTSERNLTEKKTPILHISPVLHSWKQTVDVLRQREMNRSGNRGEKEVGEETSEQNLTEEELRFSINHRSVLHS
jgi:hypothetical protein